MSYGCVSCPKDVLENIDLVLEYGQAVVSSIRRWASHAAVATAAQISGAFTVLGYLSFFLNFDSTLLADDLSHLLKVLI